MIVGSIEVQSALDCLRGWRWELLAPAFVRYGFDEHAERRALRGRVVRPDPLGNDCLDPAVQNRDTLRPAALIRQEG